MDIPSLFFLRALVSPVGAEVRMMRSPSQIRQSGGESRGLGHTR